LGAEDGNDLGEEFLVDEATGAEFALFWEVMAEPEVEAFPCFQEWDSRASFSAYLAQWHSQSRSQ